MEIIWKLYGLIDESYAFGNGESLGEATRLLEELEKQLSIPRVSKSIAKQYAEFCVRCDRCKLPLLELEDYILQYCC